MSKASDTITDKSLSLIREYMNELQWAVGGIEAALNLMYRGLSNKNENDESIAAIGMLRDYFGGAMRQVQKISDQFEQQLQA